MRTYRRRKRYDRRPLEVIGGYDARRFLPFCFWMLLAGALLRACGVT